MVAMDLYQLKTFFFVCNCSNFTKAAKKLYITQSAVSISIKKLEKSIGFELFDRSTKKMKLTEVGRELFKTCSEIFYILEKTEEQFKLLKENPEIHLKIGAPVEFGNTVLIKIIQPFLEKNPHITVDYHFSKSLLMPLLHDDLDIIIDCKKHSHHSLNEYFLFREKYICAATPEFLRKYTINNIDDFYKSVLLSCDSELKWWDNFFKAAPSNINQDKCKKIIRINHIRGLINATKEGLGIGFFPLYTVSKELESGHLKQVFEEIMPLDDNFRIYQKTKRAELKYQSELIGFLTSLNLEQLVI